MASKGPVGKSLKSSPYGDPAKALKSSPYGKLPSKSTKKPKKDNSGSKEAETGSRKTPGEGVALKEVFSVLADENGRITSAKLRSYVKELDLDFTEEEIREMMQVVDPSGKGEITYSNLLGVVRDFSHEFPTVQLTSEELSRELTYESTITEDSVKASSIEDVSEQPGTSSQDNENSENTLTIDDETVTNHVSRPLSSRARIAALAKRAIEDLDDQMSVIKEDDEYEEESERDQEENNEEENDKEVVKGVEGKDMVENEHTEHETEAVDDNKSMTSNKETVTPAFSAENSNPVNDIITNDDEIKENDLSENEFDSSGVENNRASRASVIKEHRLDSGVSTAIGRMSGATEDERNNSENGRQSRRRSTSESRAKSRRDSIRSETSRKSNRKVRDRSNSKSRKPEENNKPMQPERRKPVPRKKFEGVNDPRFYSTMGCSLKLSQIRTRQRLLYVMWRAVYDQALRKLEQEKAKHQAQKRKNAKRMNPSVSAV